MFNFNCNVANFNCSFIVLTETWLTDNFSNSELGMYNYNIFRYDRCSSTSNCLRGGGVLIGVRKNINAYPVQVTQLDVEHIFVRFSFESTSIILGGVYIPPLSSPQNYEYHTTAVESLLYQYPDHIFIICGDYNLPEIS